MRFVLPFGIAAIATPLAVAALAAPPAPAQPAAFGSCAQCHSVARGGPAGVGPDLWGVAGAHAGMRPGYAYSAALKKSGIVWNRATLTRWLVDPQRVAPGTTMPVQSLSPADRTADVAYLLALK